MRSLVYQLGPYSCGTSHELPKKEDKTHTLSEVHSQAKIWQYLQESRPQFFNIIDIIQFFGQWVLDVNSNDLPVRFAYRICMQS